MIAWQEAFCERLVDAGFFVIRFDNRDVGRSTHLDHISVPSPNGSAAAPPVRLLAERHGGRRRRTARPPRHRARAHRRRVDGRHDRPADRDRASRPGAVAGLDHVEHRQPHHRPAGAARAADDARAAVRRPGRSRSSGSSACSRSSARPASSATTRCCSTSCAAASERGGARGGVARQLGAIVSSPNRAPQLALGPRADRRHPRHGRQARAPVRRPRDGASAIRGARLVLIDGMGHDLPEGAWPQIVGALIANAARAEPARDRVAV